MIKIQDGQKSINNSTDKRANHDTLNFYSSRPSNN